MDNELIICLVILSILFISILIYRQGVYNEVEYKRSKVDNKKYLVRNLPDNQIAVDRLATIHVRLDKLVTYLVKNKVNEHRGVLRLKSKFNGDNISESSYKYKYTSYSVNKGEKIVMCLRTRDKKEELIDINTLMFVALHELSHIMTISI